MSENNFEDMGIPLPDPEEMKQVAIALITLAVSTRGMEDREKAIEQFSSDFALVTQDVNNFDWIALVSMLANCGGALVGVAAHIQGIEAMEMMQNVAEALNQI